MLTGILYEDRDILVIHKPAGLAVQTARVGQSDMVSELKNYLSRPKGAAGLKNIAGSSARQQEPYLGIVHRLDQPVEGLLVFGKNRQAAASLTGQLRRQGEEGGFCKRYCAVICGTPAEKEGELTDYLYKQSAAGGGRKEYRAVIKGPDSEGQDCSGQRRRKDLVGSGAAQDTEAGKAVLRYHILQVRDEMGLALADICIETGRFHQIRAQMAHAGMPLLGDMKYGGERAKAAAQALGVRNVALCASHLQFAHPVSGKRMDFRVRPENPAFSFFSQV